jgi:hypothetical protein
MNSEKTESAADRLRRILKNIQDAVSVESLRADVIHVVSDIMTTLSKMSQLIQTHHEMLEDLYAVQAAILKKMGENSVDTVPKITKEDSTKPN